MPYVSLYRKWRPQTFADVIGQDHVVGTLINAITTGQVHHAMLFSGTRGTGKTTSARLLAKALNCERGPTPEPCNECESCRAITDGSSLDVVEIDAASHGSVDDARDLREKATYAPAAGRFKVYIIDEAHMVTPHGFNALLKILEEPPPHVRFMFATTEPSKVIEAIRSRCQHYEFRRVRTATLAAYYGKICAAEGIEIEPGALDLIARAADGSVRDGLSRLDQILVYASGRITEAHVAQLLGTLPADLRFELGDALANHDPAGVFELVRRVVEGGNGLAQLALEALDHVRDLYVLRVAPDSTALVDTTPEGRARIAAQAQRFAPGELDRLIRLLGELYLDLRSATDQRLVLEVGLARAAMPETSLDADALLARIERLERQLVAPDPGGVPTAAPASGGPAGQAGQADAAHDTAKHDTAKHDTGTSAASASAGGSSGAQASARRASGGRRAPGSPVSAPSAPEQGAGEKRAGAADRVAQAAEPSSRAQPSPRPAHGAAQADWSAVPAGAAGELDLDRVQRGWPQVLDRVRATSRVTAMSLEHGRPVAIEHGRQVLLDFPADAKFWSEALAKDDRQRQLEAVLTEVFGAPLTFRTAVGEDGGTPAGGSGGGRPRRGASRPSPGAAGPSEASPTGGAPSAGGAPSGGSRGPRAMPGMDTGSARDGTAAAGPAAGAGSGQATRSDQDADSWAGVPPPSEPDDYDLDPADGPGEVLGADADTRAVADLAARAFGGQVIDERPND